MRLHHGFAPVLGLLLAFAGSKVSLAQAPPQGFPPPGAYYGAHTTANEADATGGPPTQNGHPEMAHPGYGNAAAWPHPAMPWPEISPFDHRFQQHTHQRGLWHYDFNNRPRQWYAGIEALVSKIRKPNGDLIGYPLAPEFPQPEEIDQGDLDELPFQQFPAYDVGGVFGKYQNTAGIGGRLGFTNPDDTGMQINAFWLAEADEQFRPDQFGGPVPFLDQEDLGANLGLRPFGGLPLLTPEGAVTVPFDMEYRLESSSEAWGSNVNVFMTPIWKGEAIKVRPTWGVRYLRVNETFRFLGRDSGLVYGEEQPDVPRRFNIDFSPDLTDIAVVTDPYEAKIRSETTSHLAGPELGLRYDLGGREFRIWGQSIFGLLANHERLRLEGSMIGDALDQVFPIPTPLDPAPTQFGKSERHTHVSPIFEQSIFAEMPIFQYVPILRRSTLLENAVFRAGWTFTAVGQVARPYNSITYVGFPATPGIDLDRSTWYVHNWSFAIDWTF